MQKIVFDHVTKYFGGHRAVNDAHFTIEEGEFFTLLGPSGCGKTTLLRAIAGFYRQEEGSIYFGAQKINDVPTHERNIGMVFQNYAIFPHMTVYENVCYGLKARSVPKKEMEQRAMEALELVELTHLRDRVPSDMSGGQQQRIALARAIVIRPGLLLMDEPLSNLDAKLRIKMRSDIRRLQKELNITTIYVTHDQEEALAVSDRIAVMSEGQIQQIASPQDIYAYPENQFVANFIGTSNFLEGECMANGEAATIRLLGGEFHLRTNKAYQGKVIFALRPERIKLQAQPFENTLVGHIESVTFLGEKASYLIRLAEGMLIDVQEHAIEPQSLRKEKDRIFVNLQLEKTTMFDQSGKEVLYRASF
ncbi:ABC transporter ATP-binding protein [Paenibacillus radicis (ex Xue et al. 2023)]|uniref:ABC transporter ATP-binding protein n=1 Tax=Paenibacillus radicis (ex Xue et al. 2023) TaxID=2972489 RepID=A0ABT1YIF4_9BACL|nr:ABC transporter ATP-binding protein [Paenibacillus radicis (ex Xue et al. 2023)]MCR8632965.1 ABC transporter ATP-binding protein [Paenibacillus radicis (ex Xue et al. 2023)]